MAQGVFSSWHFRIPLSSTYHLTTHPNHQHNQKEKYMFVFAWPLVTACFASALALIKMGSMFVWISVLSLTLKIMTILLIAVSIVAMFFGWQSIRKN